MVAGDFTLVEHNSLSDVARPSEVRSVFSNQRQHSQYDVKQLLTEARKLVSTKLDGLCGTTASVALKLTGSTSYTGSLNLRR
jgi:hypothetical protein